MVDHDAHFGCVRVGEALFVQNSFFSRVNDALLLKTLEPSLRVETVPGPRGASQQEPHQVDRQERGRSPGPRDFPVRPWHLV